MDPALHLKKIQELLKGNLDMGTYQWLEQQIDKALTPPNARTLYLTYSLLGRKIPGEATIEAERNELSGLPVVEGGALRLQELSRIHLLASALLKDPGFFVPRVARLIQVSDTGELVTLLRHLMLLPHREKFMDTAVEALRTNIASVFDAISLDNPYPRLYFNEQQWNQMYLKAAFLQRDLSRIQGVEQRANPELARIISDYAHERWAASREVDPLFWRPVSRYLEEALLRDMERLLGSGDPSEQKAGYLCCLKSENPGAKALIREHPLNAIYRETPFDWKDLKKQ